MKKINSSLNNKLIVQILLPIIFDKSFSYYAKDGLAIEVGDVVLVNFMNRNIYGLVTKIEEETKKEEFKIKTILGKDNNITIGKNLIKLIEFAASYNLAPKGLFLKLAISILNSSKDKENNQIFYQINRDILASGDLRITLKRQQIIDLFCEKSEISLMEILESAQISSSIINSLVKSRFLIKNVKKTQLERIKIQEIDPSLFDLKELSEQQQKAANFLKAKIDEDKHSVTLVDGVTGSGKTEIYFEVISKILKEKSGQILILLPEIILANQLVKRFEAVFNFKPEVWHSKINNNQKRDIFYRINNGEIKILISTRSAIFLPFSNLKLIIIDEEHESSFKQEDIVNYHGRDMAIARAKFENIPIILSSATPSLETFVNAKTGKYAHLILKSKFFDNQKAQIFLVDMKKSGIEKDCNISSQLKKEIANALENKKQTLLFLNRRGYAPLTLCKACGFKISCLHCSSYMSYHQKIDRLICHHCGDESKIKISCTNCEAENSFVTLGAGVEKIHEEVRSLFPQSRIALMTSDTLKNSTESTKIIEQIINNEVDIIIGTQIIAKGHHFPHLALVGIIDGDSSFNNANLRTGEKSFQLLTQVIGRAGREKHPAKIFLQSYNIDNLVFKYIVTQNRDDFFNLEIQNRQILGMPPFGKMIAIIFISKEENLVIDFAKMIAQKFPIQDNIEVFGPAPMPISKIRKNYYYQLLVKSDKKLNVQKLIKNIISSQKIPNQLMIKIDVDPL